MANQSELSVSLSELYGDPAIVTNQAICEIFSQHHKKGSYEPARVLTEWTRCTADVDTIRMKMKRVYDQSKKLRKDKLYLFLKKDFTFSSSQINEVPLQTGETNFHEQPRDASFITCSRSTQTEPRIFLRSNRRENREKTKELNLSLYEINKTKKSLVRLKGDIKKSRKILSHLKIYYNPVNVRRREKDKNLTIQDLRMTVKEQKKMLTEILSDKENMKSDIKRERNMKSHFKRKAEGKTRQRDLKRRKLISNLEEEIKTLQVEVEDNHQRIETRDGRFFSPAIRLCVMELLSLEVSTSQVSAVIETEQAPLQALF